MRRMFSEKQIEGMIEEKTLPLETKKADKVTLNDLVYDEKNDTMIFPKDIIPTMILTENKTYFLDYNNLYLLDDNGTNVCPIDIDDDQLKIGAWSDNVDENVSSFEFINIVGVLSYENLLNTYYLYHPITQSGTKLYKHTFKYQGTNHFYVITTSSDAIEYVNTAGSDLWKITGELISINYKGTFNYSLKSGNGPLGNTLGIAITYNATPIVAFDSADSITSL